MRFCWSLLPRIEQSSSDDNNTLSVIPTDDVFSIETGLERVGIAGPKLKLSLGRSAGSGRWTPLQKQERKGIGGGFARGRSDA